ncbi:molybdenum ABC transporter substrate-binding protein [Erythrobacter sp. SG61-1L]|uniref:molybdate ABC transporter substrate-binding protein n=1 Tax=Erythrobacter sp. SG61-1L TaxID=1603897 RepID=UPI0006C92F65|nr:molybdate ABC transporter substrate-binding protein [Erythrobacter sp. SG61-1L]KPL68031.1 molybdenum ABC transporter substrate-binding protein [Erythrobacter sp. SG61-1L]
MQRIFVRLLPIFAAAILTACSGAQKEEAGGPIVLAAASLQESLEEAADAWAKEGHPRPVLSFAATSALARQVQQGAPADLFISADEEWMDTLEDEKLIEPGTRRTLLGNSLVLIKPAASDARFDLADRPGLLVALSKGPLALADPEAVPAGKYAKAALASLGLWGDVEGKIVQAENVRAALALVERGEAALGVVYGSDAMASDKVRIIATFPADSHPPILYPIGQIKASTNPEAAAFREFLASGAAMTIFERHGFTPPGAN